MRLQILTSTVALGLLLTTAQQAFPEAGDPMPLDGFKDTLSAFARLASSERLSSRLDGLTPEQWEAVYEAFPNKATFAAAVRRLEGRAAVSKSREARNQSLGAPLAATEFTPRYPAGSLYDTFVATLPGLGLLFDGDSPGTQDDRCDDDGEADARIAAGIAEAAAIVGDVACNTIVVILGEGTNLPACIAAGVLHELTLAAQIIISQCGYQTALVDSAEIEAAYENSRQIIGTLNDVEAQLAVHDTDIKNRLATHDADVKALLATLQATVNESQRLIKISMSRQLDVLRLLITPEGQRAVNPAVLSCTGDDCPQVLQCAGGGLSWPCR